MIHPPKRDGWLLQSDKGLGEPKRSFGDTFSAAQAIGREFALANDNLHVDDLRGVPGYVYLGSPYSKYPDGIEAAADVVTRAAAKLMQRGISIFCPIAHSHAIGTAGDLDNLDWVFWQFQDQPLMDRASALIVLMMDGWQVSVGLKHEIECFQAAGKPIVYVRPEDV